MTERKPMSKEQRASQSARMKARWKDPAFQEKMRRASSAAMKARWKDPGFRDNMIRQTVDRWQNPVYRRRQIENIIADKRPPPFQGQPTLRDAPGDPACDVLVELPDGSTAPCVRSEDHAYHVAVSGTAEDWTLRVHGRAGD